MSVLVCSMKWRFTPFIPVSVISRRKKKDDDEKLYQNYYFTIRILLAECNPATAGLADQCLIH